MKAVNKSRPSQQKRQRERQKQERRTEKQARRQEAAEKRTGVTRADGIDPDLEGIKPGPQPLQDWQKIEPEAESESEP
jgi:hypothetical protein